MALGERINVAERIEGREWNKETYPTGLQDACIMRHYFWRNAHVSESMFGNFWIIILDNSEYKNPVLGA